MRQIFAGLGAIRKSGIASLGAFLIGGEMLSRISIKGICILLLCLPLPALAGGKLPEEGECHSKSLGKISADPVIPAGLMEKFGKSGLDRSYKLVFDVSPFYLCADFDGDGKRDYAVNVRGRNESRPGVWETIILRANGMVNWLKQDTQRQGLPGPAWRVLYRNEQSKILYDGELPVPKLAGDGIILETPRSSSVLVYWNGKRFDLYWQSD